MKTALDFARIFGVMIPVGVFLASAFALLLGSLSGFGVFLIFLAVLVDYSALPCIRARGGLNRLMLRRLLCAQ
jgi:hypothetical protein